MGYRSRFEQKLNKYGQTVLLHKESLGEQCPGFDSGTGYCDPQYHRSHPEEAKCNSEGFINSNISDAQFKAFVQPLKALATKYQELYQTLIGQSREDNFVYLGPTMHDIRVLKNSDYVVYDGNKYKISNPDEYKIGDEIICFFATLELINNE